MEITIYYEDTDCGGVVYYANYLRYMERGRTEYLADRGHSVKTLMDEGTVFVVAHASIDYRAPARYGNTVIVETWVSEITKVSIMFEHTMKEKKTGKLLTECRAKLVCTDTAGKPKRMPQEFVEKVR